MKNNHLLLPIVVLTIFLFNSCSKDDDSSQEQEDPVVKKYLSTYKHIQAGNSDYTYEHTFLYNSDKTLDKIIWEYYLDDSNNEIYTYKLSYDSAKRINKIEQYLNDEILMDETTNISYDNSGYISQIGTFPVSFNSISNTYTLQMNDISIDYVFNNEQDITVFDNISVQYDPQNKGAGYDSKNQILSILMRSILGSELLLPLSKRPILSYDNAVNEKLFSNQYDEEGYLIKSTESTFNDIYEFSYINL